MLTHRQDRPKRPRSTKTAARVWNRPQEHETQISIWRLGESLFKTSEHLTGFEGEKSRELQERPFEPFDSHWQTMTCDCSSDHGSLSTLPSTPSSIEAPLIGPLLGNPLGSFT